MGIKSFILKQVIKRQIKDLPEEQQNVIIAMVEKHPEIFERMAQEIKEKKKAGIPEQTASLQVMMKYRQEMQKIAQDMHK